MIPNMVITPVVVGGIRIGEVTEKNGKRLPKKSDEFHITSNVQQNGAWIVHPIAKQVHEPKGDEASTKLRSIPVRIMFDTPENNFRSGYACFNKDGRQICSASGKQATRIEHGNRCTVDCPGPDTCQFGQQNRCKPYARLLIAIDSDFERDPLAAFAFRTTSYNSVSALTARLTQYAALTNQKMAGMPCNLVLRAKSTAKSMRQAIYYCDLEPREGIFPAVQAAFSYHKKCEDAGINLEMLDKAVAAGFANASFTDNDDDEGFIAEEFYPPAQGEDEGAFAHDGHQQQFGQQGFDPNATPSQALTDVLNRIWSLPTLKSVEPARVWVKEYRDFAHEGERNQALDAIHAREQELLGAGQS